MSRLRELGSRLIALFRRRRLEADFEEELQAHLQMLIEENLREGMDEKEARRRARIRLGGLEQIREAQRDQRGLPLLETFLQDCGYALRRLRREPGLACVVILTMALGIGANTAIFSLLQGVLLRPLPYPEPERLVRVFEVSPSNPKFPVSPMNLLDYQREAGDFVDIAGYTREDLELSGEGPAIRLKALRTTANYFQVLGASPALGRAFEEAETKEVARVVIISDGLWQRKFDRAPDVIGRTVQLDGHSWSIVGVMPPRFQHAGGTYRALGHGEPVDAWWPLFADPERVQRGWHFVNSVARLKPEVTRAAALERLNQVAEELEIIYPDSNTDWRVRLEPLQAEIVGPRRTLVFVLMAAVLCVLLIACANVASLLLARSFARQQEVAVREALGAGRGRLVRQVLTESLILGAFGGVVGLFVAFVGIEALTSWIPTDFPRLHGIRLDRTVLLFAAFLTVATVGVFGLVPALRAGRNDPRAALISGGRSASGGPGAIRMRNAFVVGQICLASVLLVSAGLLLRSFLTLESIDPGFQPEGVLTSTLVLPEARYEEGGSRAQFLQRLLERLEARPEIDSAGVGSYLPWTGWNDNSSFTIINEEAEQERSPNGRYGSASPGYFEALGLPLITGRFPRETDRDGEAQVLFVNRSLAEAYFPEGQALGARVRLWGEEVEIVGVIGDLKDSPGAETARPAFFWPYGQRPFRSVALALRTSGDPASLAPLLRRIVAELDPNLALAEVRVLEAVVDSALGERRFLLSLVSLFASLALLLSAVGAYGVIAYRVQQRRRELGIRVAIGANSGRIVRMVLGQGIVLTLVGLSLGGGLALAIGRGLDSLLFGVAAWDPFTFAVACLTILLMGLAAATFPALRAGSADPLEAMRVE